LASGIFEERGIVGTQVGNIDINADSVLLTNNSLISAATFGIGDVGDININAIQQVSLDNSFIQNFVGDTGQGKSDNINIETGSLSLTNDARLVTGTLGQGNSGDITINAIDNVVLDNSIIDSFTGATGVGNSGKIAIAANNLSIANGGKVSTATLGKGNSGNIDIQARGGISIDGIGSSGFRSGIETSTEEKGEGDSGNINIETGSLSLTNNASINASTFGVGLAGDININAKNNVSLTNNARINASTFGVGLAGFGVGLAGDININAKNNVSLDAGYIFSTVEAGAVGEAGNIYITTGKLALTNGAQLTSRTLGTGYAGNINIKANNISIDGIGNDGFSSGLFSNVEQGAEGDAGSINIASKNISVSNGAQISVDQQGIGNGGNLSILANSINLNKSSLLASTNSGIGGNTNIKVNGILSLENNSSIQSGAFGNASGGSIAIDSKFIVASPNGSQDIDIIAGANTGKGGNISIKSERVFGFDLFSLQNISLDLVFGLRNNGTNDIAASGNLSIEEGFTVTNFDVVRQPANVVEPDQTVASACGTDGSGQIANSFTITGRGGMPTDPTEPLSSSYLSGISEAQMQGGGEAEGLRGGGAEMQGSRDAFDLKEGKKTFSSDEVIPARGMTMNEKGQIVLTAYPTPNASDRNASESNYCSSSVTQEELLATNTPSDRAEDVLDDRAIAEIMNLLYSQGLGQ
jgi:large exoprotein involved in heme utilization and adhesion